ncbi:MAG: T9SS type A sorting domain-containing protein [Ignavibacteriae bacterium]|nr:T9SS type A sorting domain-containing protein [Ignavibacteriota bacterium]
MNALKKAMAIVALGQSLIVFSALAGSGDTLRIASYNLLNFPGSDVAARVPYFRMVVQSMKPDILVVQEVTSQSGMDIFLANVMNAYQPARYTNVPFHDGPDTDNGLFFNPDKVSLVSTSYIQNSPRHISEYVVHITGTRDTLRIYSLHLKASSGTTYEQQRLAEATTLRNYLNALPAGSQFIIVGDYNIYRSDEPAFQKLLADETNNNGRVRDPLNAVGVWNNYNFRFIHTQSPRVRSFGGGSTGGMDDRFDMILPSYALDDNLMPSSYTAYGNDGNHYNDSINRLPNAAVPDSVANALHYAADHIPIFADFRFGSVTSVSTITDVGPATYALGQNYPNPFNPSTQITYTLPWQGFVTLKVYNLIGQQVATLVNGEQGAGAHTVVWNADRASTQTATLAGGVYFYRLQAESFSAVKRMVLLK